MKIPIQELKRLASSHNIENVKLSLPIEPADNGKLVLIISSESSVDRENFLENLEGVIGKGNIRLYSELGLQQALATKTQQIERYTRSANALGNALNEATDINSINASSIDYTDFITLHSPSTSPRTNSRSEQQLTDILGISDTELATIMTQIDPEILRKINEKFSGQQTTTKLSSQGNDLHK